jgi:hypothetical protein
MDGIRRLHVAGALGAVLWTGADKTRDGYANGDSLLVDVARRVFAVADAGERFPAASARLLERLAAELEGGGAPADPASWQARMARVWGRQPYIEKTTLSCVAIQPRLEGWRLLLIHGGDSRIAVIDRQTEALYYGSRADMNFAGRSPWAPAVQILDLPQGSWRIVLATDGLNGLLGGLDRPETPSVPVWLSRARLDRVLETVAAGLTDPCPAPDDAGLIVVAPAALNGHPSTQVLMTHASGPGPVLPLETVNPQEVAP